MFYLLRGSATLYFDGGNELPTPDFYLEIDPEESPTVGGLRGAAGSRGYRVEVIVESGFVRTMSFHDTT
jgi:hypothetical protein